MTRLEWMAKISCVLLLNRKFYLEKQYIHKKDLVQKWLVYMNLWVEIEIEISFSSLKFILQSHRSFVFFFHFIGSFFLFLYSCFYTDYTSKSLYVLNTSFFIKIVFYEIFFVVFICFSVESFTYILPLIFLSREECLPC